MEINIDAVTKRYGTVTALDELELTIPSGAVYGVLGTNGAGKTTLFRMLVGLDHPDAGSIIVGGRRVGDAGIAIRDDIGFLPERVGYPDALTAAEVIRAHGQLRGGVGAAVRDTVLETVELDEAADRRVGGFSNGMRRRLGLATALLARPSVLILDEPTAGLDPIGVDRFHRIIERIATETESTVVFSSHDLADVERLCDRAAILHDGHLLDAGPVETLYQRASTDVMIHAIEPSTSPAASDIAAHLSAGTITESTPERITATVPPTAVGDTIATLEKEVAPTTFDIEHASLRDAFGTIVTGGEPA